MTVKILCIIPLILILSIGFFNIGCEDNGTNYQNVGPNRPHSPLPDSGAINQALDVQLVWSCSDPDGDRLTYDIFFGTAMNPPSVATGRTDTTYFPGSLDSSTTYYWKIVARDSIFFRAGPIWKFTTADR